MRSLVFIASSGAWLATTATDANGLYKLNLESGKSYQICGVINQVDDTTLEITELPIRKWTQVGRDSERRDRRVSRDAQQ